MNTSHYPPLALCKKLTESWFTGTEKRWIRAECIPLTPINVYYEKDLFTLTDANFPEEWENYFCPSVMEMLAVMPVAMIINWEKQSLKINSVQWEIYKFWIRFWDETSFYDWYWTLPNALAEMILWLVDNKYLTLNNL